MIRYIYKQTDELYHHGIKGQKWGVRRYQNKDGTYTDAGKKRKLKTTEQLKRDYPNYQEKPKYSDGSGMWILREKDANYDKQVDSYLRLQKAVEKNSVDWYNSRPKSEGTKQAYINRKERLKKIDEDERKAKTPYSREEVQKAFDDRYSLNPVKSHKAEKTYSEMKKANDEALSPYRKRRIDSATLFKKELLDAVLGDLGYESTEEGRRYIEEVVIWD